LIIGIDNNLRAYFFGDDSSTDWNRNRLQEKFSNFKPHNCDIRNYTDLERIFQEYGQDIQLVIHTAAQPSHDWAAKGMDRRGARCARGPVKAQLSRRSRVD
jgi:CDP-paratose 2-epimerase